MLILIVSPSLKPRSSWGLGPSAFSFSMASAFFTYLKWSWSATLKSNESDRSWKVKLVHLASKNFNFKAENIYTETDPNECRSSVIVLNAENEVSRAVRYGFDGHSRISFNRAVCEELTRHFVFEFNAERGPGWHHSHSSIPSWFIQVPIGGSTKKTW